MYYFIPFFPEITVWFHWQHALAWRKALYRIMESVYNCKELFEYELVLNCLYINQMALNSASNGFFASEFSLKEKTASFLKFSKIPPIPLSISPFCHFFQVPSVKPINWAFHHNGPISLIFLELSRNAPIGLIPYKDSRFLWRLPNVKIHLKDLALIKNLVLKSEA